MDTVVIDELHLTVSIPHDLPDSQREEVRQTLAAADFMDRLREAVRVTVRAFPELVIVQLSVTR